MRFKPELVIFDCDGVLIDSEALSVQVELEQLRRHGCSVEVEEYLEKSLGRSDEANLWREIAESRGVLLPPDFAIQTHAMVSQAFTSYLRPIPGVADLLAKLEVPYCVASASRPERLDETLGLAGLRSFFNENIFSASQVERGKPHPDLFLFAAERMSVPAAAAVVIEDSVKGVLAGCAAGMTTVGFVGGSHCPAGHADRLRQAGARFIFREMAILSTFLRDLTSTG